ncbi:hypothetical protein CAPTEDRAFT_209242 [Capitella teleta]|uniref:Uncharacterized protein n=1 Tax=Capitella teleta TaxID=283909 RepID=R7T9K4_CAPTE|nr:hypothetical protein CAPTEDRAFT_209242 [Capitella teleta]|eukprot:ELT87649.1 hypothetical protein CAPTEDRAFT_209242 [Capitella teleta]
MDKDNPPNVVKHRFIYDEVQCKKRSARSVAEELQANYSQFSASSYYLSAEEVKAAKDVLIYRDLTDVDEDVRQRKSDVIQRLEKGRKRRLATQAKESPPLLEASPSDLMGRRVLHQCSEDGGAPQWYPADPNIQSNSKCECMTPLHKACADNKHKFVTMLMEYGADCNQEDASGHSATTLAAKLCHEECLQSIRWHTESKGREKEQIRKGMSQFCNT